MGKPWFIIAFPKYRYNSSNRHLVDFPQSTIRIHRFTNFIFKATKRYSKEAESKGQCAVAAAAKLLRSVGVTLSGRIKNSGKMKYGGKKKVGCQR